jgi:hypothetical protein
LSNVFSLLFSCDTSWNLFYILCKCLLKSYFIDLYSNKLIDLDDYRILNVNTFTWILRCNQYFFPGFKTVFVWISSIFIHQKTSLHKNGVEFHQKIYDNICIHLTSKESNIWRPKTYHTYLELQKLHAK